MKRTIVLDRPLDLRATVGVGSRGEADPTVVVRRDQAWKATRTPDGPAAIHIRHVGDRVEAEAWGPGREWVLDGLGDLVGEFDVEPFTTDHPKVGQLHRRRPGLRMSRTRRIFEALLLAICEQKVTGYEAARAYRQIVARWGEPAPGPTGLTVPPDPAVLADVGYHEFHPFGLERKRAEVIRRVAARAPSLERLVDCDLEEADRRLRHIPGVGVWTSAWVRTVALGDADAVLVGDYHLCHHVVHAFTGRRRGSDEEMLALLEPFRPHRGRVSRLLYAAGSGPERRGPRMAPNEIARR